MNKIAFINCSPRGKNSNSSYFIHYVQEICGEQIESRIWYVTKLLKSPQEMKELVTFDQLVFVAPLYVDSMPTEMIMFLQQLEEFIKQNHISHLKIYGVFNCGFIEGTHNDLALKMLNAFSKRAGLSFELGLGIGGGEFMGESKSMPMDFFIKKPVFDAFEILRNSLINNTSYEEKYLLVSPKIPRFLFIYTGHNFWIRQAKENGLSKKDIYRKYIQ